MKQRTLHDADLGEISLRFSARTSIAVKRGLRGGFIINVPNFMPVWAVKQHLKSLKPQLMHMAKVSTKNAPYTNGQQIGHSHKLSIVSENAPKLKLSRTKNIIAVALPPNVPITDESVQNELRTHVANALRKEASAYLPRRLKTFAERLGCHYEKVRFSHASTRWGSCSSTGTISLNIALMTLPDALIDYVLIHELCHTKEMNHSPQFWQLVESADPHYKAHRKQLKNFSPYL